MSGVTLRLQVDGEDAAETDALGRQLLRELRELPIEDARQAEDGAAPDGTKAMGALAIGGLLVDLAPHVVPHVMEFLKTWFARGEGRKIRVVTKVNGNEVEAEWSEGASEEEIAAMVERLTRALGAAG